MNLRRAPGCWGEVRGAHLLSGAEARRSSPVEKKKKNSTARARGHKRAKHKHFVSKEYRVLCKRAHSVMGARWPLAQGGRVGRAGESSAFCPPTQPCRKLVVFFWGGKVRGAHLLSGAEATNVFFDGVFFGWDEDFFFLTRVFCF